MINLLLADNYGLLAIGVLRNESGFTGNLALRSSFAWLHLWLVAMDIARILYFNC